MSNTMTADQIQLILFLLREHRAVLVKRAKLARVRVYRVGCDYEVDYETQMFFGPGGLGEDPHRLRRLLATRYCQAANAAKVLKIAAADAKEALAFTSDTLTTLQNDSELLLAMLNA